MSWVGSLASEVGSWFTGEDILNPETESSESSESSEASNSTLWNELKGFSPRLVKRTSLIVIIILTKR